MWFKYFIIISALFSSVSFSAIERKDSSATKRPKRMYSLKNQLSAFKRINNRLERNNKKQEKLKLRRLITKFNRTFTY